MKAIPDNQLPIITDNNLFTTVSQCQYLYHKNGKSISCPKKAANDSAFCVEHFNLLKNKKTHRHIKNRLPDSITSVYEDYLNDADLMNMRDMLAFQYTLMIEICNQLQKLHDSGLDDVSLIDNKFLNKILNVMDSIRKYTKDINELEKDRGQVIDVQQGAIFVTHVVNIIHAKISDANLRKEIAAEINAVPFSNNNNVTPLDA